MKPLAEPEPGVDFSQYVRGALQRPGAQHAAQGHFLLLAAGVAGPVKPVQVSRVGQAFAQVGDVFGRLTPAALPWFCRRSGVWMLIVDLVTFSALALVSIALAAISHRHGKGGAGDALSVQGDVEQLIAPTGARYERHDGLCQLCAQG